MVLESLQRVLFYVQAFEKQFVQEQRKELAKKRRELAKSEKRIDELDILFQRIYEDNVSGKLSDKRFATMSANYEAEQKALKEFIDYIMVSKKQMIDGKTVYPIDIYYSGIGIIDAPSAEEYEDMFQERLKQKHSDKEKTA